MHLFLFRCSVASALPRHRLDRYQTPASRSACRACATFPRSTAESPLIMFWQPLAAPRQLFGEALTLCTIVIQLCPAPSAVLANK